MILILMLILSDLAALISFDPMLMWLVCLKTVGSLVWLYMQIGFDQIHNLAGLEHEQTSYSSPYRTL